MWAIFVLEAVLGGGGIIFPAPLPHAPACRLDGLRLRNRGAGAAGGGVIVHLFFIGLGGGRIGGRTRIGLGASGLGVGPGGGRAVLGVGEGGGREAGGGGG